MLHKLARAEYEPVRSLFTPLRYNLVIDSILDGNTHGRVYADDPQQPRTAVVWNELEAILLAGDPTNPIFQQAFAGLLQHEFVPLARAKGVPGFTLHLPTDWADTDQPWLAGLKLTKLRRRFHRLRDTLPPPPALPVGYTLHPLTVNLLDHSELGNIEQLLGWIYSFWAEIEDLLAQGVGYYVLHDQVIASWCLTVYASGPTVELGVATAPAYRQQGLATVVAAASVADCLAHGRTPVWQCNVDNSASLAVARNVGFVPQFDYAVYSFDLPIGQEER